MGDGGIYGEYFEDWAVHIFVIYLSLRVRNFIYIFFALINNNNNNNYDKN